MTNNINIDELNSTELDCYNKVLKSYKEYCAKQPIVESGINSTFNYVYIKLLNEIEIICFVNSAYRDVRYLYDNNQNETIFYDTYKEAINNI